MVSWRWSIKNIKEKSPKAALAEVFSAKRRAGIIMCIGEQRVHSHRFFRFRSGLLLRCRSCLMAGFLR